VIQVIEKYSVIFDVDLESSEWKAFRNAIKQSANAWPSDETPEDLLKVVADLLMDLDMLDDRHYLTSTLRGREALPEREMQWFSPRIQRWNRPGQT
jgi:hypothetical protein